MTVTQFVKKWAPQESSRFVEFTRDVEALLDNQRAALDELLVAIEETEWPS